MSQFSHCPPMIALKWDVGMGLGNRRLSAWTQGFLGLYLGLRLSPAVMLSLSLRTPRSQPTFLQVFPSHCTLNPQPAQTQPPLYSPVSARHWATAIHVQASLTPTYNVGGGFLYPHGTDEETE